MLRSVVFFPAIMILAIMLYLFDKLPIWVLVVTISPAIASGILSIIIERKIGKEAFKNIYSNTAGYVVIACASFISVFCAHLFDDILNYKSTTKLNLDMFIFFLGFAYMWIATGILLGFSQIKKDQKETEEESQA